MTTTFAQLGLPDALVSALDDRGITEPFPVQAAAIPDALDGHDVCGKAPTGSGKTLAFGLPVLTGVERARSGRPRALVLAPTRELAEQIKTELAPLAKRLQRSVYAIYGGVGYGGQKQAMRRGVDVLVACPGRLEDLIEQGVVDLSDVNVVVLDEADRMADMGFLPSVRRILDQTQSDRQTLLFSATLDGDIATLSRKYQSNPKRHETASVESDADDARHHFWLVQHHDRVEHTADVVKASGRTIAFTRTRHGADRLAKQLGRLGVNAVSLHGGRSQNQRQRALDSFAAGKAQALIATDVAARGIHVDSVASVIHFDPAGDHKDYLHRSGRTGRAGATGTVISLVTGEQRRDVQRMQRDLRLEAPIGYPDLDALVDGGHVVGESGGRRERPRRSERPDRSERPARTARSERPSRSERSDRPAGEQMRRNGRHEQRNQTGGVNDPQRVYVANLPWSTTDDQLRSLFAAFGDVEGAAVVTNRKTGRSKGFGFVNMPVESANKAISGLNGSTIDGRDLTVRLARPQQQKR